MMLFKNNSLALILHAAKTKIDAILLCLSNLNCVYLFVIIHVKIKLCVY